MFVKLRSNFTLGKYSFNLTIIGYNVRPPAPIGSLYQGFTVFTKSQLHKSVGGVLLYANTCMKVVKINKTKVDAYELIYIDIMENSKKFIIGVVYQNKACRKLYNAL